MVETESGVHWRPRDWIAAAALFATTSAVVLWQNAHAAILWDLGYVLDSAARIAAGQIPYRDFPFAHAPLTFLIQAAIIRLTGRVYFHHVLYVAALGGASTVLTWRIALRLLRGRAAAAWSASLLLAAPLTLLGIYCILPHPEYDCDCVFCLLAALWLLLRADRNKASGFAAGVALIVPLFFKQNIGLPFLAAAVGAVALTLAIDHTGESGNRRALWPVLAGAAVALAAALLALHWTVGLGNYLHWTIGFAAARRLPGLSAILNIYRDPALLWTLPCIAAAMGLLVVGGKKKPALAHWISIAAFALLSAPFLFALAALAIYEDADERSDALLSLWPLLLSLAAVLAAANLLRRKPGLLAWLPLILLATIHGAFLSQQLWGSTYAIWPLFVLLAAELLAALEEFLARRSRPRWFSPAAAALVSATLLICGGFYIVSEERLSYAQLPDAPPARSATPALAGMATPGPFLSEFDELLRYAEAKIPSSDGVLLLPGEEPFFFASGRAPRFPVTLFDPATLPYSPAEVAAQARAHGIRWLIVKRNLQIKEDPTPERAATLDALMAEFTLTEQLRGYDIYLRP